MKKWIPFLVLSAIGIICFRLLSDQMPSGKNGEYYPVIVNQIIETGEKSIFDSTHPFQLVKVRVLTGDKKNTEFIVSHGEDTLLSKEQLLKLDDKVVISVSTNEAGEDKTAVIIDRYRLPGIHILVFCFILLILFFAGKQGIGAIVGLLVSACVILSYIVPQIMQGREVVAVTLSGAVVILFVTMYLAHGFNIQTTVSVLSTAAALACSGLVSFLSVHMLSLYGMGSEEANLLKSGVLSEINLKGLLLAGMILGILGILDDVTTSQVASIFALSKANRSLTIRDLIYRGLGIGREHIASLVNTLVLAYAGASFPLFIFFVLNPQQQPAWVLFNSEFMAEEIVRTVTGSMGLILGVPLSTILASIVVKKRIFFDSSQKSTSSLQ